VNIIHKDGYLFMSKLARQQVIVELAREGPITSQEALQRALAKRGLEVGQATLSRDVRDLALIKTVHGYMLPAGNGHHAEPGLPPIERLVREFVQSIRPAQNLIVLKTAVGSAQPVAAALDAQNWSEVVGTIAGDDAILVVSPDKKAAGRLAERIRGMLA
jgi:transcriptional regulator of arginine metabolism